jgi:hypothetical protein
MSCYYYLAQWLAAFDSLIEKQFENLGRIRIHDYGTALQIEKDLNARRIYWELSSGENDEYLTKCDELRDLFNKTKPSEGLSYELTDKEQREFWKGLHEF